MPIQVTDSIEWKDPSTGTLCQAIKIKSSGDIPAGISGLAEKMGVRDELEKSVKDGWWMGFVKIPDGVDGIEAVDLARKLHGAHYYLAHRGTEAFLVIDDMLSDGIPSALESVKSRCPDIAKIFSQYKSNQDKG